MSAFEFIHRMLHSYCMHLCRPYISALVKASQKAFLNEKPLKVRLDQNGKVSEQDVTVVDVVLGLHGSQSQLRK